jgi:hypothetical protein
VVVSATLLSASELFSTRWVIIISLGTMASRPFRARITV